MELQAKMEVDPERLKNMQISFYLQSLYGFSIHVYSLRMAVLSIFTQQKYVRQLMYNLVLSDKAICNLVQSDKGLQLSAVRQKMYNLVLSDKGCTT